MAVGQWIPRSTAESADLEKSGLELKRWPKLRATLPTKPLRKDTDSKNQRKQLAVVVGRKQKTDLFKPYKWGS